MTTISDQPQIQGRARGFGPGTVPVSMTCTQFLMTNQLAQSHSVVETLVRIAALFDKATGRYIEPDAASLFGEDSVDQELRALHLKTFRDWLSNALVDQKKDLEMCGPPHTEARATLLRWFANNGERLIPPGALKAERMLFQNDLSLVLCLLSASDLNHYRHGS